MDELLRSLRNLGLKAPDPSQLVELLDEDENVQEKLARILSLSSLEQDLEEAGGGGAASLMGQELLQEAVKALLDNFHKSIKRQQQVAERERNGGVKKIKWAPRKALIARQAAALQRLEKERQDSPDFRPRLVFDGIGSYYSTSSLTQLTRLRCADLCEAPKRYTGSYLLCRVISPLLLYAGVTFIVDDPTGAAVPVSVSHFTSNINMTTEEVSRQLPAGTIIAIREPYVSLDHQARAGPCAGKADHGIRIDSPTDLLLWEPKDGEVIDWAVPIQSDTLQLDQNSWLRAGISLEGYDNAGDLHNAVSMLLSQDRPGQAYRQIYRARQKGVAISPSLEGRVLSRLDAWEAARDKFNEAANAFSDSHLDGYSKAALDLSIGIDKLTDRQASLRCQHHIRQISQGISISDMQSIYFAAANGTDGIDTSDHIGPVEVKSIPGAGRGMVTTRAVEAGELLLSCKAVCPTYADDEECRGSPLLRLNLENGVVSTASQVRAQTRLIHAIIDRPELALPILGLTAGPSIPNSDYVSQEYPLRSYASLDSDSVENRRPDVDAKYVDAVLRFNAFGPAQAPSRSEKRSSSPGEQERSTMPHPLLAILNHACYPNATSVFFSNIYTTRALCHLPAGTEIVHQYTKGEEPYAIRSANLSKHGFECGCLLCRLDRADGVDNCAMRARIVQGESKAVLDRSALLLKGENTNKDDDEAHGDIVESLNALIIRIQATYSEQRGPLRPDLFTALNARTRHLARKSTTVAITSSEEALTCCGAILNEDCEGKILQALPRPHLDSCIALMLFVATLLANDGSEKLSLRWTETAFWAHQCTIGGGSTDKELADTDVFLDRWGVKEFQPALDLRRKVIEQK